MDSLTQAVLGAVVGEVMLSRKLGWRGAAWGAFFGTLPDLDILAYPFLDEIGRLKWHRGISHSIMMMVIATVILAWPLARCHRRRKLQVREAGSFIFWVWSTHVLIDVFTTYGTQIFEPFSDRRVALNNFFIIDPLFTLPLLFALLWVFQFKPGTWQRKRTMLIGGGLAVSYVMFSFVMKGWATLSLKQAVQEKGENYKLVAVAPAPLNTLLWRGLFESPTGYAISYWSPFDEGQVEWDMVEKNHHLAEPYRDEPLFEALVWFSRGHWVAREESEGMIFIDMRFGEVRDPEAKRLHPTFRWHVQRGDDGQLTAPSARPSGRALKGALQLLGERIVGDTSRWGNMQPF